MAAVQEELGVTAEQKSKLAEIAAKIQDERSASFGGRRGGQSFQDLSDAERAKFLAERAQQRAELSKKIVSTYKPQVAAVLDTAQMERLQQIGWQAMGALALQNEAMVKALELSKEAQDKIAAAVSDYNANAPRFGRGGGGTSREERQALQTKRDDAMMAALTDAQEEAFAKLKGKAFDVSVLTQRGQGRGAKDAAAVVTTTKALTIRLRAVRGCGSRLPSASHALRKGESVMKMLAATAPANAAFDCD